MSIFTDSSTLQWAVLVVSLGISAYLGFRLYRQGVKRWAWATWIVALAGVSNFVFADRLVALIPLAASVAVGVLGVTIARRQTGGMKTWSAAPAGLVVLLGGLLIGVRYFYLTEKGRLQIANYGGLDEITDFRWIVISSLVLTVLVAIILCLVFRLASRRQTRIAFLVALCIAVGVTSLVVFSSPIRALEKHLDEYTGIGDLQTGSSAGYVSGKIVAVDRSSNGIDDLYIALPKDLRAKTHDDVGTVIWVECDKIAYGTYTDGATAYRIWCDIEIIDRDSGAIVAERSFPGSLPPPSKSGDGDRTGSKPTTQMIEYITDLPRR